MNGFTLYGFAFGGGALAYALGNIALAAYRTYRKGPSAQMSTATPDRPEWQVPTELRPYLEHTSYPDRIQELYTSPATPQNNIPLFIMNVETRAEIHILTRLHRAGLLKDTPDA